MLLGSSTWRRSWLNWRKKFDLKKKKKKLAAEAAPPTLHNYMKLRRLLLVTILMPT
jgi:hypothetical protein